MYEDNRRNGFVSPEAFASTVSFLFHELYHVRQMVDYHGGFNKDVCDMAISRVVADANGELYFGSHQLFNFENNADYNGYLATRKYLAELFDDSLTDVDRFLVGLYNAGELYPETKMQVGSVETADDLNLAFQAAKRMCLERRKQYAVDSDWNYVLDMSGCMDRKAELKALRKSRDPFARIVAGSGSFIRWGQVRDAYLNSTCAEDVDRMMACVTLYLYPHYLDKFPILQCVDLSPKTVFGMSFLESRRMALQRLADIAQFSESVRAVRAGRDMYDIDAAMSNMSSESEFESEFDC